MNPKLRSFSVLLLTTCLILACGDDLSSEDHLNTANEYLKVNKFQAAIIELKNALRKDENNTRARATLGTLYFNRSAFEDADKELTRALSSGSDPSVVVPILAQVLLGLGEYDRLDNLPVDGLDSESRSTLQAAQSLSKLYRNKMEAASEIMETALKNEPSSPFAKVAATRLLMAKGLPEEARSQLKEVIATSPKYAPAWITLGDIERVEKQPEKAEKAYSKALKFSANNFEALLNRAVIRVDRDNTDGATEDLSQLQRVYGRAAAHPGVQFVWGIVYLRTKQFDEALKALEKAAEHPDQYPEALYYLALIHSEKGRTEQAFSNVNRYLGFAPGNIEGAKLAAKLEIEQKNYRNAERLLLPVVSEDASDADALNLLATALLAQGETQKGTRLLAKVAELVPDSVEAKVRLGAAYLAAGSEELGIETLEGVLEKNPTYDQADNLIVVYYLRESQVEKAIVAAQAYNKRNPSAKSYVLLARTYLANNEQDKAKEAYNKALEERPGDPVAGDSLAGFALVDKDYETARKYYAQVIEHNPDHIQTRLKIAASFAMEGKTEEMLASLDETMAAYPRAMEPRLVKAKYYIGTGELDKAIPLFESLSEKQRDDSNALEAMANFELAAGRYNQAVNTIGRLIEKNPNSSDYHFMKSRAYAGLGDTVKLTAELERTLELEPTHFNAKVAQARLALLSDRPEEFQEKLAELQKIAPENAEVIQLDVAYAYKNGDNERAEQLVEGLFAREPNSKNVIALATLRQSVGDVPGAIALLQGWIKEHFADVKAREMLAEIYIGTNQAKEVMLECQEILKLDPDNIVALNNLAWYLLKEDPKQALVYAERAIALAPESSPVLDTLAMAQLKNNDLAAARMSVDRALSGDPKSVEIRYHEAKIRAAEGDRNGAIVALNSLLEKDAEFAERVEAEALLKELKSQGG